jgi:hypothetical protein
MNFHKLKNVIKSISSVNDITHGNEYLFTLKVKDVLPNTNFELLGEQLVVGKDKNIGKCDLWLVNLKSNFLLSLELKVGDILDIKKQNFLKTQTFKYTDHMRTYFPEEIVYGLGAYKCILKPNSGTDVLFFNYIIPNKSSHKEEIDILKSKLKTNCLN